MTRWTVGRVRWPAPSDSGSYCIDIDGPVTVTEGTGRHVMPLDGATVVASPVDARFTFDGTDAISVPDPTPEFLYAILDPSCDLTYTGGSDGAFAILAFIQFLDASYVQYNEIQLANNEEGFRTLVGSLSNLYVDPGGYVRLRVENNSVPSSSISISGSFCFDWRIGP